MLVSFKVFQINAEAIARFPAMTLQMSDDFEKTMDDFKILNLDPLTIKNQ